MMKEQDVLAQIEGLTVPRLRICIQEAWVCPARSDNGQMFDDLDIARLRLISELTQDLDVNDDAVPIILSLVDQLNCLRRQFQALDQAVADQDKAIKDEIAARLRATEAR